MQRESNWRYWFIGLVVIICLMLIYPTMRYVGYVLATPQPQQADYENTAAYEEALADYEQQKQVFQRGAIKLGLDLVGGVDVLLEIDEDKTRGDRLRSYGEGLVTQLREKRIDAQVRLNEVGDKLLLTLDDQANARQVVNTLADYVDNGAFDDYDEQAFLQSGEVALELTRSRFRRELGEAIASAEKKIRDRVDEFGVTQPSVSRQTDTNTIRVQIPGEKDPERVIREIIRPAQLEFFPLYTDNQSEAPHDELVRRLFEPFTWDLDDGPRPPFEHVRTGRRGQETWGFKLRAGERLPAGYIMLPGKQLDATVTGEEARSNPVGNVYVVKRHPEMNADHLREAYMQTDPTSLTDPIYVGLTFDRQGARQFHQLSKEYLQERVAIALDRRVYSAPVFQSVIPNGQARITGGFKAEEAQDLALVLKAGALPADLKPVEKRAIGPTLGEESIVQSSRALAIGAAVITVFMVVYYGTAGVVSIIALLLNVLVIIACLDMFDATLTLSGIGGMILTLGMAVDANVLIYERIREEIDAGRPVRDAIRSGFGAAFSVILDSNLTTLLAAFVLLQFGEGSVQGFALTMAFGLLANLFTGLTVTYALCALWFRMRGKISLGALRIFRNPKFNFIGVRYFSWTLSVCAVVLGLGFLIINRGPEMAVDFKGGVVSEVRIAEDTDQSEELKKALGAAGLTDQAKVQRVRDENLYIVRLALIENSERSNEPGYDDADRVADTQTELERVLSDRYVEGKYDIMSTTSVSQEVGQAFREIAIMVTIAASFCILLYLWFRFELVFGVAAVVALLHDLTITLAVITLLDVQISLDIVSALLILLGFSVNDTIVIFDRIRENSHRMFGHDFKDICNAAMNRSLSRTVITSFTTIGVMLIMYLYGGHSLAPFALTLIVGGIVGTYSSDFLAAPLVFWWNQRDKGRLVEELGRKGAAAETADSATSSRTTSTPAPAEGVPSSGGPEPGPRRRGRR